METRNSSQKHFTHLLARAATGGAAALALALAGPVLAQGIGVQINGSPVSFREAAPVNSGGSVLVPMRGVFEALNARVRYVAATSTIIANRGESEIQLTLGASTAYVNGQTVPLSQPARSISGSTFVPLRFVADALGATVRWDAGSRTVVINDPTLSGSLSGPTAPANPTAPLSVLERIDVQEPARVVVRENGALRSYDLAANAEAYRQVGTNGTFGPLAPIELTDLRAGEDVRITQANGMVTQIIAQRSVRPARVRQATGNQIITDDGTVLTIGTRLRYFDASGREATTANLAAGTPVALYLRPNGVIYGVSAAPGDVAAVTGGTASNPTSPVSPATPTSPTSPITGGNNGGTTGGAAPNANSPRINLVRHSATRPVTTGAAITVEVRGTAGQRGAFDLSPKLRGLALREEQAGVYRGAYTVKAGDDVLNSYVTARLSGANGEETAQSREPLTIDTTAPVLREVSPRNGGVVTDTRPTIVLTVTDVGGSGLASARVAVTKANGQTFERQMTVVPPSRATVVIDEPLSGQVLLRFTMEDAARNVREQSSRIIVQPRQGAITSIAHDATRPLRDGGTLTVDMQALPGGRATFDMLDANGRVVVQRVPMSETNTQGRYRGTHTFADTPSLDKLRVVGRFDDGAGAVDTLEATTEVLLARDAQARAFTLSAPAQGAVAGREVIARGKGTPGALVDVSVTARGVRTLFGIIGYQAYQQVLDTKQVQVDAQGNWVAPAIALTAPRNVAQLTYEVNAIQTDAGNIKSDPQTVTLTPEQ
jgi:antitoxin (DNA-binding transcriptional repressor) of toxin-antitoxin stability system